MLVTVRRFSAHYWHTQSGLDTQKISCDTLCRELKHKAAGPGNFRTLCPVSFVDLGARLSGQPES